jgi:glyoxylase-like metal-dependent hydrolase (beta-lactamase superfamily II)
MSDGTIVERSGVPAPDPDHGVRLEVGAFGPWETNAYLVWDGRSPDAMVLDPGMGAAAPLMERVSLNGLRLHLIANSHGHIDHVFDDGPLMRSSAAPLAIHPDDAYRLDGRNNYGFDIEAVTATSELRDGEQVRIGDLVFDILHTPGHTEGSVCLLAEDEGLLYSGDTLFAGGWGRVDFPGGDPSAMAASLARLSGLEDGVAVFPGHGQSTTIGRERAWLELVRDGGRLFA